MEICKNCNTNEAIKYSKYTNGNFCSKKCARAYSTKINRDIINKRVSLKLKNLPNRIKLKYNYVCEKCNEPFITTKKFRIGRPEHCNNCRRKTKFIDINKVTSITELSKRTVCKILKRANAKCPICGWNKSSLDLHHIISKKKNGSNEHFNLIALCPNCHRMAHNNLIDINVLMKYNLTNIMIDWKKYYNIKK
jgi:5-methylcytosine-specific restriction endonuclease McrA